MKYKKKLNPYLLSYSGITNYGLLFVPNLMKKDTNGSANFISVINLGNMDYKNNFKIIAPEQLTQTLCNDGSNNYCINFNLSLTDSANDGTTDISDPKINKRQLHRIKINSINNINN